MEKKTDDNMNNKSRRARRMPKRLLAKVHEKRSNKNQWLETHIWHAKRMHMTNMWGYRLALRPTDKGLRATAKAYSFLCTLHDASYQKCIEITSEYQNIINVFKVLSKDSINNLTVCCGTREGSVHIYHPSNKYLIGPCTFMWQPIQHEHSERTNTNDGENNTNSINTNIRKIWLWTHPAIHVEIYDILNSFGTDIKIEIKPFCRFELRGKRSHNVLKSVLKIDNNSDDHMGNQVWKEICTDSSIVNSSALPHRCIIALRIYEPNKSSIMCKQTFDGKTGNANNRSIESSSEASNNKALHQWLLSDHLSYDVANNNYWNMLEKDQIDNDDSKGDHEKESNSQTLTSKDIVENINTTTTTTTTTTTNSINSNVVPSTINENYNKELKLINIILIQKPCALNRGRGSGWDIIMPQHSSMNIFKQLHSAGGRAVGIMDRRDFLVEQGIRSFPFDYPDTLAGRMYEDYITSQLCDKYSRKPPAKRVDFTLNGVKYPFGAGWYELINDLDNMNKDILRQYDAYSVDEDIVSKYVPTVPLYKVALSLEEAEQNPNYLVYISVRLFEGQPSDNAMICEPSENDIKQWADEDWSLIKQQRTSSNSLCSDRLVIGYLTYGKYSFIRCNGYGIGFCRYDYVKRCIQNTSKLTGSINEAWVWVRNITHPYYKSASLKLLWNK